MTEPLKLSRWRAHERRSEFDAKARALASAAGLPTGPTRKRAFRCPHGPVSALMTARLLSWSARVSSGGPSRRRWRTGLPTLRAGSSSSSCRNIGRVKGIRCRPRWSAPLSFAPTSSSGRTTATPRDPAGCWTRGRRAAGFEEGALRGGELDLEGLAWQVTDLENWADSQPDLTACHEKSHRTWRCQGLILLSIQRRGKGLLVKSGVHMASPSTMAKASETEQNLKGSSLVPSLIVMNPVEIKQSDKASDAAR